MALDVFSSVCLTICDYAVSCRNTESEILFLETFVAFGQANLSKAEKMLDLNVPRRFEKEEAVFL